MFDLILAILRSFVFSFLISSFMGVLYFFTASLILNFFELNRGVKPMGLWFFNGAVAATIITFFVSFSFFMRG